MNPWAIQSLAIALLNLILGLYILRKGPKRSLNRVFSLFAFSLAVWGISEFGHRSTESPPLALLWMKGGAIGWCFMPSLYLHFILIFTKHESWLEKKWTYVFLYLPSILFFGLFLFTETIYEHHAVYKSWGYTVEPGSLAWTFFLYYFVVYILTIYYITMIKREGLALERQQAKPLQFGTTIFLIIGTATNLLFPLAEIQLPEIGSLLSIILTLCTAYAILKYKLFIIAPQLEELKETNQKYLLEQGVGYIIKEAKLDKSYDIFTDQLIHGGLGLCLTKLHPTKVRNAFGLAHTPIVWVTFEDSENTVSPKDIYAIESVIFDFLSQAEHPVILIDCFNEIRLTNGIDKALYWLQSITTICKEKDCILLVSVNPDLLEDKELALIEKRIDQEQ